MLIDNSGTLDCVWKRAITSEMLRKPVQGARMLARAAERNLAYIVGSFNSWPAATKTFFAFLRSPFAKEFLSNEQLAFVEKHVPKTYLVKKRGVDTRPFEDRSRFIIKPTDEYNAVGVIAGSETSAQEWSEALTRSKRPFIAQEYAPSTQPRDSLSDRPQFWRHSVSQGE